MAHRILLYGSLPLAASGVLGGYLVHRFLDRPGETAFAMIPANALGAASLDLVPGPDQVLAFKHIDDTIAAANGGKTDAGSLLASIVSEPRLKLLAKDIDRSAAFAWLPIPGKNAKEDGEPVVIVALKDPATFQAILGKERQQVVNGTTVYWLKEKSLGTTAVMVRGAYAIASDKAWPLVAVDRVVRGQAPALAADPGFAAVRRETLPSANLQVFVSPKVMQGSDWTVASMTVRESGIEIGVNGQTDDPKFRKAGSLRPLAQGFLDTMPPGAYGYFAMSQPGPAVALADDALDDPAKEFGKETDLDLRKDVLPALGGDVAVAFYPTDRPDAGLDLLVSVDAANGADPADLARKLEGSLNKEFEKDKSVKGPWKVAVDENGVSESRLAPEPTDELQKGLRDAERSYFRPLTLSRGKTVAWATVDGTVLLATSQSLLDRAVLARRNIAPSQSLSGDAALAVDPAATADAQFSLAISMRRLVEGIRNTVDPSHMSPSTATTYRKTLGFFDGTDEPFAIRSSIAPDGHYRSFFSFPVDWSKLPGLVDGSAPPARKSV